MHCTRGWSSSAAISIKWAELKRKTKMDKKLAFTMFSFPPDRGNVGTAAYQTGGEADVGEPGRERGGGQDHGVVRGYGRRQLQCQGDAREAARYPAQPAVRGHVRVGLWLHAPQSGPGPRRAAEDAAEVPHAAPHQGGGIVSSISFSPQNGMLAVVSYSQTTVVYAEDDMEPLYVLHGQLGSVTQVLFSKDGNYLYNEGRKDPYILCWGIRNTVDIVYK
uniref:Predicted protein n=1 Tax=Hordeum vulgare subsp. vulgare TaxID=112509 RepID=F2DAC3_HORVV|nr:predicted protein [Hordeum vulgare subsp. vulgare]